MRNINLSKKSIVVIDDESDFGSINIGKPESKIYSILSELSERTQNLKFISVTATPYGNIMSNKSSSLIPQAIVKLKHDEKYCGLDFFNNKNCYEIIDFKKSDIVSNKIVSSYLNDIVKKGLKWYLISSSFFNYLNKKQENFEMLINIDLNSEIHNRIESACLKLIEEIKNLCDKQYLKMNFSDQINFFIKEFNLSENVINDKFFKYLKK